MIRLTNLTLMRAAKVLLKDAGLTLFPGHKVGLVGPNGCGKSSLFAMLLGTLQPEAGSVELPGSWVIAHVAQDAEAAPASALEHVLDGDQELREVEHLLAEAETEGSGEHIAELHTRMDHIGGYQARVRAATLLSGLGFSEADQQRPVAEFSGGWRMRLNLAQALMCRSDLLLLDEPTNHLDLDAVLWLEDWLAGYQGTLLLITHDRDFLDAVVGRIVHVENEKLNDYTGNYSTFETTRASQLALQQSQYVKQQRTVAHMREYIDRFRYKASKARQAQSRLKALERMELIAAAHVDSPFEFQFREPDIKPRQLIQLIETTVGYAAKPVVSGIEWTLFYGDRIGLLGPNGAGKSTLLKSLVGDLPLLHGTRHVGQGLKVGYFHQHQVEQLRMDESPLQQLQRLSTPNTREQELRNFLGGFDFRGDRVNESIAPFSGGEKARLALALIVWQKPNLLLLDEPTNHLDIDMREALAEALQDFEGTLVVIAHDRHLLKATTDQLWLVADHKLSEFNGDLDDYKVWAREYHAKLRRPVAEEGAVDRKALKRAEAEARQKTYAARKPFEQKLAKLEKEIDKLNLEKSELDAWLVSEAAFADENRELLQEKIKRQGELKVAVENVEWQWFEVQRKLEEASAAVE